MYRKAKKAWTKHMGTAVVAVALTFLLPIEGIAAGNTKTIPIATSGNAMAASDAEGGDGDGLSVEVRETVMTSPVTASSKDSVSSEKKDKNILSVKLPVVAERKLSPFDFFLDPCGLLYETDAVRYGGGTVEEGATLLFHNQGKGYAFSRYSDKIVVADEDGEAVIVTVSASVSDLDGIALVERESLFEAENPCMYLALTDDQGNEQPIFQDAEAVICMELDSGTYSFGLTGECNPDADWQEISVHPKVTVTWHVESMMIEDEDLEVDEDILLIDDVTGQEPVSEELQKLPAGGTVYTKAGSEETVREKKDLAAGEDILSEEDVIELESAPEELLKLPVNDTASAEAKLGEKAEVEESDDKPELSGNRSETSVPSAEESGAYRPDTSGDGSGNRISLEGMEDFVSNSTSSEDSSADAVSPDSTENNISDPQESEEYSENSDEGNAADKSSDGAGAVKNGADDAKKRGSDDASTVTKEE